MKRHILYFANDEDGLMRGCVEVGPRNSFVEVYFAEDEVGLNIGCVEIILR